MKSIFLLTALFFSGFAFSQEPDMSSYIEGSFMPDAGEYIVNGWVKELLENQQVISYENTKINIILLDATGTPVNTYTFTPTGNIIDGWQKIDGIITILPTHSYMSIELLNQSEWIPACFDDVRFFPIDGNMKGFVYDPDDLKIMSELDENNYASFYEYDQEGGLVRVKKETEKGIFTIKESRSSTKKTNE
ncbi:hypothetical protein [Flavobacterium wongokense]|uniref:hypothetical protein n=1 Tax=Flavobacterium wongokense TaxID=2910674 RepID=UPI001F2BB147|nr:hypothetical protein [Flavobacterium sp. WG47]MCF6133251.1 hypothetical protein [Flavobacterium sp. WG47]